jgi:hypothetical protein
MSGGRSSLNSPWLHEKGVSSAQRGIRRENIRQGIWAAFLACFRGALYFGIRLLNLDLSSLNSGLRLLNPDLSSLFQR